MKKTILFLAIGLIAITANAQKMKESEVPATVKAAFAKKYPAIKAAKWEMENGKYEAEFYLNKVETSVLIDVNENITETESEIALSELPKSVSDYFKKNLLDKKINEASKITDAEGKVTFEAEIDDADYIFDASGAFVKKMVEAKDNDDKK